MNKLYINIVLSTIVIGAAQLNFSMSASMARPLLPAAAAAVTALNNTAKRCCSNTPPTNNLPPIKLDPNMDLTSKIFEEIRRLIAKEQELEKKQLKEKAEKSNQAPEQPHKPTQLKK